MSDITDAGGGLGPDQDSIPHMLPGTPEDSSNARRKAHTDETGAAPRRRVRNGQLDDLHSLRARAPRDDALNVTAAVRNANVSIERAAEIFDMLVDGYRSDKPLLRSTDSWVVAQLEHMKQLNFVTQHGREYVNRIGKPATDEIHTPSIALSGDAVRAARTAQQHFGNDPRVAVLGFGENPREHEQRLARYDAADVFVLPEGDPRAPQQFIDAIRYLAAGATDGQPAERRPKQIVVTNYGFYRPLLIGLFGLPPSGVPVREYYRQALEKTIGTANDGSLRAKVVLAERLEQIPVSRGRVDAAQDGRGSSSSMCRAVKKIVVSYPFFGSAQQHKLDHWIMALGNEVSQFRTLTETDLALGDPPERYRAYEANSGGRSPELDGLPVKLSRSSEQSGKCWPMRLRRYRARSFSDD